jgi:glycosyltransferase involved in cell wall biosynthesis
MRVLFTTPILEYPAAGGPQLRIENTIKALSKVCDLHIIHRASHYTDQVKKTDDYFSGYSKNYLTVFDNHSSRFLRLIGRVLRRIFLIRKPKHAEEIIRYIKNNRIDLIWFGYGNISYPLIAVIKERLPTLKVVCDTDSVWSRFILRELPFARGRRKKMIALAGIQKEKEERNWVNLCEVTTAVSEVDAKYYREISAYPNRIHLFSNVIDIKSYAQIPLPPSTIKKPAIFLAGSFGPNSAMNMAAQWILDEVLPILHERFNDLHFYIVGRDSDKEFGRRAGANVTVTGRLDSVLPYLCHSSVALVPLKFESGTRFKILEAGACHIPIVSTTLGAEGLPVVHGEHVLIADDAIDFAHAIARILSDPSLGKSLAQNCYKLVKEKYSLDSLVLEAVTILEFLKND